jgi:hypothetical protein
LGDGSAGIASAPGLLGLRRGVVPGGRPTRGRRQVAESPGYQAAGVGAGRGQPGAGLPSVERQLVMVARRRTAGRSGSEKEKGAVAAEFAVVLPIFLVLVLGIFWLGQGIQFSGFAPV